MRRATLYRLSGLAVTIGMVTVGIASVLYPRADDVSLYSGLVGPTDDLAKLFGSLTFLIGFPGLYAFQAERAGKLGLVGFVLSFFGLAMLEVSTEALFGFAGPELASRQQTRFLLQGGLDANLGRGFTAYFTLSYVVILAGFLTYGIATSRAGVYPRWAGAVIAIGAGAAIVLAPLTAVPSGPFRLDRVGVLAAALAFVWCGLDLTHRAAATRPGESDKRAQRGRAG